MLITSWPDIQSITMPLLQEQSCSEMQRAEKMTSFETQMITLKKCVGVRYGSIKKLVSRDARHDDNHHKSR